ncbi:HAD-IIA family hydrolase [Salibacterium aidingense]|uniref:HAD-IIA family hydrolase n=1 Tax=Salibacterium aidingense TaxID=384933 RepID=UPI00040E252A|nr:HAD-IIA family hydrolase [Salibacterium aidingense]
MREKEIKGLIIDIDGTVFHGEQVIDGAAEILNFWDQRGMEMVFLSNRGNISRKTAAARLQRAGVNVHYEQMILSSYVSACFLKTYYPTQEVWLFGDKGLREEMEADGIKLAAKPEDADWVVITLHETLTYKDLNAAFRAVKSGANILATNKDKSVPDKEGKESIDVAGMIGAIETAANRQTDIVIGKPSHFMMEAVMKKNGSSPGAMYDYRR